MKLNTYLNFGGNCESALQFYEAQLGGKITALMRFADMPQPSPGGAAAAMDKNKIMHARINLAGVEIMASDAPPGRYQPMRSAYLSLTLESAAEAERVYGVLKEHGEIFMELQQTFFAPRFAMLRDRYGVNWMILTEPAA